MTQSAPAPMAFTRSPEVRMPPSAMAVTPSGAAGGGGFEDGGELRDTNAGHDACRADRAGTDADFDRVGAGVDEGARAFGGGDVAGDDV